MHFYTEPRDYQAKIVERAMSQTRFGLFDEPGTGKSKLAIDIAVNKYLQGKINKVVIICPSGLACNWRQEIEKHCDSKHRHIFEHGGFEHVDCMKKGKYSLLSHDMVSRYAMPHIDKKKMLIIDESHNFANVNSRRGWVLCNYSDSYTHILTLTGTPKGNKSTSFYIQMVLLGEKITEDDYNKRYATFEQKKVGTKYFKTCLSTMKNENELIELLKNKTSWTKKRDVMSLPPRQIITQYYELTPQQQKTLEVVRNMQKDFELNDEIIKKTMHTVGQIYSGFIKITENENVSYKEIPCGKLELLKELLIANKIYHKQFIIFTKYLQEIEIIKKLLTKLKISFGTISGENSKDRDKIKNEFINGEFVVLIGMITVLNEGFSFNNATCMIYYSNEFSVLKRTQSLERNQRINQNKECVVYDLVCKGGYDEMLLEQLNNKCVEQVKLYDMFIKGQKND